jgi:hypothetical protein
MHPLLWIVFSSQVTSIISFFVTIWSDRQSKLGMVNSKHKNESEK